MSTVRIRRWYEDTPYDFRLAVKGSRFITHNKKLADPGAPLANFWAQGVLALGHKLGPEGRDVYVYFDNDQEGHAPGDALRLAELLEDGR